ncbi:MAG: tetratricopeptide repeat protein [Candidatus Binatia bacterium]
MRRTITLTGWIFLAVITANVPAHADQLRDGLIAFKRHDYPRAAALLRSPAEAGAPRAQAVLCYMYTYGRGVPQSYREAASWCVRAANQGNSEGQYMLGLLYNKGHGVPEDFIEAYKWLNLATARASGPKREFSYRIRDSVASKMSPAQLAKAQALAVEWRSIPELHGPDLMAGQCAANKNCRNP